MKRIVGHDHPRPGVPTEVVFKIEPGDHFRRVVWEILLYMRSTREAKERQLANEARAWAKSTHYGRRAGSRKLLEQAKGSMLILGDFERIEGWCRARLAKVPHAEFLGMVPQEFFRSRKPDLPTVRE